MRIGTFNISSGFLVDADRLPVGENLKAFAKQLEDADLDVICLQEVAASDDGVDQAHQLAELLGDYQSIYTAFHENHVTGCGRLGVGILSWFPIASHASYVLPDPELEKEIELYGTRQVLRAHVKGLVSAYIDTPDGPVRVVCGHLVPFRRFEEDPMDIRYAAIHAEVERVVLLDGSVPTIFAGDMNSDELPRLLPGLFQKGYQDAIDPQETTLSGRYLDHVLYDQHWQRVSQQVTFGCGDHALCFADLRMR